MRVRSNVRLAAGLVVASCQLTLWAQAPGAVAGFVLDEAGRPVAGAEVSAFPSNRPSVGMLPHSISGPDGSYLITGVSPGLYRIAAEKPREGYGNPIEVLFESRASLAPSAEVRPGETTDGVAVRLGPRGGWVSGAVKDAVTGATVLGSSVALLYAASSQEYGAGALGATERSGSSSPRTRGSA